MNRDLERVARLIAARRGELGLTQEEVAERAEVDRKTIYNLEAAERWPQAKTRSRIERALRWYPGDLQRAAEGQDPVDYDASPPERNLLANLVQARMAELDLTWGDVARDAALSEAELRQLRVRWLPVGEVAQGLDRAMRWEPGSVASMVAGQTGLQRRGVALKVLDRLSTAEPAPDAVDDGRPAENLVSKLPRPVRQVLEGGQVEHWHMVDVSSPGSDDVIMVMWVGPKPEDVDQVRRDFAQHRLRRRAVRDVAIAQQDKWDEIIAGEQVRDGEDERTGGDASVEEVGEDQSNGALDSG
ncbi:transcriptional regulator [Actinomadura rubrisoli]|uniref:Transcriptional regulator n=1 Tax=Actinomadura rubrisoli TaxID=2530368 RepID=A0A4R4ZRB8_9ACTN|nr:transcriptional regulator [Actinomadura rubrisoli]TDD60910.1 transcriptional regulator [Actinomadura rubrisoli]